jgi:arylsulfatase A-like enzyme
MDGVNLVPFVTGETEGPPHQTMFWRSGGYRVLLAGDWKIQVNDNPGKTWLYDLKSDPTEQTNQATTNPDKLTEMKTLLDQVNGEQAKPLWPSLQEGAIAIDHPLDSPESPKDEYIYWSN